MVVHVSRITMDLQRKHRAPPDHTDTNQSPQETNHVYPHIHISARELGPAVPFVSHAQASRLPAMDFVDEDRETRHPLFIH